MNLVEGVQEEIKRVTAIIQEYSKYEGGQLAFLGFAMVGKIEAEKLNLLLMFNQGTNVCFSTKAPLLQSRCYVPFFFGI